MSAYTFIKDSLQNLVAGLGTARDKSSHSHYTVPEMDDQQLLNAFRGSWTAQKGVSIPAIDACRNWRSWQANKEQIELIEAEEERLNVKGKILEALLKSRLFGGAALFIGTGDRNTSTELKPDSIRQGGIKYLTVMTRRQLSATEIEQDPQSPRYGKPKAYRLPGSELEIHPSRLVIFVGVPHPDPELAMGAGFGWGDSVLLAALPAVRRYDETVANVVSLVYEAKIDVINIPNLMTSMQDKNYERQLLERLRLAATAKGINGTLILDGQETHTSKSASFSTLPDVIAKTEQGVAGAFDVPITRMFGQSSTGLGSNGEENTRNYYDNVASRQKLDIKPAMGVLDECLIRSALGDRPKEIHYTWAPLWQPTAKERADIGKTTADTIKVLKDAGLFPEDALSQASVNLLVEQSVMPGLEAAIKKFGAELPDEEDPEIDEEGNKLPSRTASLGDAAPRPLYVQRKVTNGADILAWAKSQGFDTTVPAEDLHVTIAYSRQALDWMKVGGDWGSRQDGGLTVAPGGARLVEPLGSDGAVVLLFNSSELAWRHMQIREAGASWDFEEYQPHVTITYQAGELDLSKVEPYRGKIEFGPEIFEDLQ
ncbi:phage-related protein (TIGR01555 family) [Pseudomonas sp. BIGb0278]|uniref:anti-CBASS protein Acb1 family protein n=1 Tax=Pseudomonas sp. BIGb0278 TaxID=2940607 RepID=UPI002167F796|nr:anti-CBASS Acb1 family protein [Pseudomonas sp. BIGb0278]MCS4284420.1 phage-related protein (TIGR01555 family) [Pseudomonas sp. BIGb0278]